MNLTNAAAQFKLVYVYGADSTQAGTQVESQMYDVGANAVYDFAAIPQQNFKGAIIIESTAEMGAMSTITGGGLARGSYVGATTGAKTSLLPFVAKSYGASKWTTFVSVQNTGAADTDVTIHYSVPAGATWCATGNDQKLTVKAGSMVIFDQASSCLNANTATSATLTSSGADILAVVDQESSVVNNALVSSGFASSGTVSPAVPLINEYNKAATGGYWRTALLVFNNGSQTTHLKLTYQMTDGTKCTEEQDVPAQGSKTYLGNTFMNVAGAKVPTDASWASTCKTTTSAVKMVGSAYVAAAADNSTAQPIVIVVNQDLNNAAGSMAGAYGSFDPAKATNAVVMPLIMDNNGNGKWGTSFNVMNVGDTTPFVKCTFQNSTYVAKSNGALAKFGGFEDLQRGKLGLPGKPITNATCKAYTDAGFTTIDANAKIVAAVNERGLSGSGDLMLTYEAINVVATAP